MKVFVLVWEDRHSDADVRLFDTPEKAVEEARRLARANLGHYRLPFADLSKYEGLTESMERSGWLYYIRLHDEGPSGYVEAKEVQ